MTPRRRLARWLAWIALAILGAGLHLWRLEERSFHHDEAIHAALSWDLAREGRYRYDPTYHGPLLYHLTAASYLLLGDSDFTARLPVALAGILMLGVAWELRRTLGERAAWWTGLLFAVSPLFLYYGRFLRMDVLEVLTASAALVAFLRVLEGSARAWLWVGLWAGLALATKENVYVTLVLLAASAAVVALREGPRRAVPGAAGWAWEHRWGIAAAAGAAVAVSVPLYTVGFAHPEDWAFPVKAVTYWWGQHSVQRVSGPWWYHLPRLVQYEFLPLAAACWYMLRRGRRSRLEVFLFGFGVLSVAMYAWLGEKTPWLGVHQVWAFIPLAGLALARAFSREGGWGSRVLLAAGLAATVVTSVAAAFVNDEISPNLSRVESLIYVQTCPELLDVVREGLALAGSEDPVAAVPGEAGWPLTWYWRHLPVWWGEPEPGMRPPLVICDPPQEEAVLQRLGPGYVAGRIPMRAWWVPEEAGPPTPRELLRYLFTRRPWSPLGFAETVVLRRTGGAAGGRRPVEVPAPLAEALGVRRAWVEGEGLLREPHGLDWDGSRLAVADTAGSRVVFLDAGGRLVELAVPEVLREPEDVAWAPGGVLVVADTWNHRVLLFDTGGGKVRELPEPPGGWYGPRSVAVAPDGTLAVADTGNRRIVLFSPGARRSWIVGEAGSGPGELEEPVGVAWQGNGELVVCDTGNHRIQVFARDGRVRSVVDLEDTWKDPYPRPQVAVLAPGFWVASDWPAGRLVVVRDGRVRRVDLGGSGMAPTGLTWTGSELLVADARGRVWGLTLEP